ncbi:GntR family transcriptional regulator [Rhizobium tumorigenes]|uniref:GntR family transcriptional regulator n=1 Tax=Rhizobium tumorigenes TaxID=2041385 RepID=A0AAF1K836_9HYPH|nr:GntR family transcriptional regulator [Rhizobium tumorigenes]WFR94401.1 GntR family transcriptional regulator [Rhizobium tumorigenes]
MFERSIRARAAGQPPVQQSPVYLGIRSAILGHSVAPGMKLPEDELAEIYSVSRTVIRAALQALALDHLVTLEVNRGAFVAKPTRLEAREVFEARALLEPKVAAMAAEIAKPADIVLLQRHIAEEHAAVAAGRDGEAVQLSGQFHVAIAEIANHSIYIDFVRRLCSRSSLIVALYWRRRDAICEHHAHHALVNAIASNKPKDASELMVSHLVDLFSGLDLSEREPGSRRLAEILKA